MSEECPRGPVERIVSLQSPSCKSCAHTCCLFHGEQRRPIYGSGITRRNGYRATDGSCWIDPASEFGTSLLQANPQISGASPLHDKR